MDPPKELKYTKDNSWVKVDKEIVSVGITKSGADQGGEFVFVDLPKKGDIKKGEKYVSVESVKWSGHLSSPVSGEIVDVNQSLFDEPSKINKDPYGSWIMKVKLSNKDELKELLSADKLKNSKEG